MLLKITWEVDDGYCGKRGPHTFEIDTDDYCEDDVKYEDMSQDEKDKFIDERIEEHFNETVSFCLDRVEEI